MITSQDYTKCKFNNKIVWVKVSSAKLVEYYYEDDTDKHIYKVQISFFRKNAKLVK
jgi:hypothetical protein